jgi:V8-like Glu-specific endopeptidase
MVKGEDDPVYLSLWNRLAAVDPKYQARVRNLAEIEDALWVVEAQYDAAGQLRTQRGTAFALEGYGLVTAAHCVVGDDVSVYQRTNPEQKHVAKLRRYDFYRDVAVLDVPAGVRTKYLRKCVQPSALKVGAVIHTAGYPDNPGALQTQSGTLERVQTRYDYVNFFSSFATYKGASGSPLLDARLKVCGIVLFGPERQRMPDDNDPLSSAVIISEIDNAPAFGSATT